MTERIVAESRLMSTFDRAFVDYQPMKTKDIWTTMAAWRKAVVPQVKQSTGRAVHLGYDWHAFSYGFTPAKSGSVAKENYQRVLLGDYLVLSAWSKLDFGFRCSSSEKPDFSNLHMDVLVTSTDFSWSMIFTHEQGFGPYFVRRSQSN